jgi:phenylalanine-4-hydroxylase
MFHDIFGHLPFMVLPEYTALQELFAPAFQRASAPQREDIKRLAWFSTEFGLIREDGEIKIFGAGLISSSGEMENVLSGNVPLLPFTIANVLSHDKAIWSFNQTLFVFDSLEALKAELQAYFAQIGTENGNDRTDHVESREMGAQV